MYFLLTFYLVYIPSSWSYYFYCIFYWEELCFWKVLYKQRYYYYYKPQTCTQFVSASFVLCCFSVAMYQQSCEEYKHQGKSSGSYWIDPDGSGSILPFRVSCNMTGELSLCMFTFFSQMCFLMCQNMCFCLLASVFCSNLSSTSS